VELKLERLTWVVQNHQTSHLGASNGAEESILECTRVGKDDFEGLEHQKKKAKYNPMLVARRQRHFLPNTRSFEKKK
jgi:hypothetical protein